MKAMKEAIALLSECQINVDNSGLLKRITAFVEYQGNNDLTTSQEELNQRKESHGMGVVERAIKHGWDIEGDEGAWEYITRMAYECGWGDRGGHLSGPRITPIPGIPFVDLATPIKEFEAKKAAFLKEYAAAPDDIDYEGIQWCTFVLGYDAGRSSK
jgi:hypothetical protein